MTLQKVNLFATMNSIQEALDYGVQVGMGTANPAAVTTALYVLFNTMVEEFNKQNESN